MMQTRPAALRAALGLSQRLAVTVAACHKNPPIARPTPPPSAPPAPVAVTRPPAPPEPVVEPTVVPPEPVKEDAVASASLDDLNRNSPLKPAFFDFDSSEPSSAAQAA